MDAQLLSEKFSQLGARLKIEPAVIKDRVSIDIRRDHKGEFYLVRVRAGSDLRLDAIDVQPRERHLLLLAAGADAGVRNVTKQKFLCGHDERAWFVAAVPEDRSAANVRTAMEALKPLVVLRSQDRMRTRFQDRNRRRNSGFVRQGEWFFVPDPRAYVNPRNVLRNEPLQRTGGKPHWAAYLCRWGGEVVYVSSRGRVFTEAQYKRLGQHRSGETWRPQRRNMRVMVKGRISHPDHKTILLRDWHGVVMNTEHQSEAMRFVAFID
jgi:hypothetical protein